MRLATICTLACLQAPYVLAQEVDRAIALSRLGITDESASQLETATNRFENLGITVFSAKALDAAGNLRVTAWDDEGHHVDLSDVRRREISLRRATPTAKYHSKLATRLAEARDTDSVPILLWLDYPAADWEAQYSRIMSQVQDGMSLEERDAVETQADSWLTAEISLFTASRVALVEEFGVSVSYASTGAPVLVTSATPDQVLALAGLTIVDTVYLDCDDKSDTEDDVHDTHRMTRAHDRGATGLGVSIAILENNRIDENHPWLTNCLDWFDLNGSAPDDHVQATAGCAASEHPSRLGSAPDASLYSANAASYGNSDLLAAADWITSTPQIAITNGSFGANFQPGTLGFSDRLLDFKSRMFVDSYVMSSGNNGLGSAVLNIGWNLITVGSHTGGDDRGNWDNDVMSSFSCAANPSTGCQKPNLAAVGENLETLGDSNVAIAFSTCGHSQPGPWVNDNRCGTSFASPYVAGSLACALPLEFSLSAPEAAMALLMATAWHNIEGSSRLSNEDGAGGLHGGALVHAAAAHRVLSLSLTPVSFQANGYATYNLELQGGDRTRMCIAWASSANAGFTTDVLDADLDVAILAGANQVAGPILAASNSISNNFEIVEFTPPVTGTYTVRIDDTRFDGVSERFGLAWSQKYDDTTTARLRDRNIVDVDPLRSGPTIGERFWLDIDAPYSPHADWLTLPGVVAGDGFLLGPETWSPLVQNFWTDLWLENLSTMVWPWRGFTGLTDAIGVGGTNRLDPIFDFPFLVGLDIQHIGFLLDPTYPQGVREITEVHTMEIVGESTPHTVGDDSAQQISLPFSFPFYGNSYSSVFINANGSLTFNSNDPDWTESEADMLADAPRIAVLWRDLSPQVAGTVTSREIVNFGPRSVMIEYHRVTELGTSNENTARVQLFDDGRILMRWNRCDLTDCLVGLSPGGGLATNLSRDLTAHGSRQLTGAIYELFESGNPFDLRPGFLPWWSEVEFVPDGSGYLLNVEISRR